MATEPVAETAPAKINLALHVLGRRADGYHELDSLVVFADFGDRLIAAPAEAFRLELAGPFAAGVPAGADNLVVRALRLTGPLPPVALRLVKNLPHAAGIGGGSSDAAAALRLAERMFARPLPSPSELAALGADIPVCLAAPRPVRMRGLGEALTPLAAVPPLDLVLVNPGVAVPTGQVFAALPPARRPGLPELPRGVVTRAAFLDWLGACRNDLEEPARRLAPAIGTALAALRALDAGLARMSGSGATVFGVFPTQEAADRAARTIAQAHPGWWVRAVRTAGGSGDAGNHEAGQLVE